MYDKYCTFKSGILVPRDSRQGFTGCYWMRLFLCFKRGEHSTCILKSDLYRFHLSPSSLWTLLLPVVVVIFVLCLGVAWY